MARILVTGEALIDFVPVESAKGTAFLPRPGGGSYNVAKAAARQGAPVAFVGPISTDLFGDQLAADLLAESIDIRAAPRLDAPTPLAFVRYEGADARYAFFDRESTMTTAPYRLADLPLESGDLFHAGSISLVPDPGGRRLEETMRAARGRALLSLDPNARPSLIRDADAWRARIDRLCAAADVLRLSDEDLAVLRPGMDSDAFIGERLADGTALVVLTHGAAGATAATRAAKVALPARPAELADTVGAGDTVMGTLLADLLTRDLTDSTVLAGIGEDVLALLLRRALAAAAINCGRVGCDPPTAGELSASGLAD